ncbi:MAG: hypothetical protein V4628_13710 [Pseudomonadota bacterium]
MPSCRHHIFFSTLSYGVLFHLLVSAHVYAQDPIPFEYLLFEAHPLSGYTKPAQAPASDPQAGLYIFPSDEKPATDTTIDLYLDSITETEANDGPFASVLLEQYLSLGKAYQQNDMPAEAIETLEKAEYISRINSGLYDSEQFVIVENLIASYLANGEPDKASEKMQYLLFLSQQAFGRESAQAVPILRKLGDWQMAAFSSVIYGETPFTISINAGPNSSPRDLAFGNLYLAQNSYYRAITNLVANRRYNDPELDDLETKLIEAIFLSANRQGLLDNPDFYMDRRINSTGSRIRMDFRGFSISYINGRNAYQRLRLYEEHKENADPVKVAQAIIGLADWCLLFNRRPLALRAYEEAFTYMHNHNIPEDVIAELLHPQLPHQLPQFTALPHSRKKFAIGPDAPLDFSGYVDVSFQLSRYGNVHDLKITNVNGSVTKNMERRLRRLMRASPFRPRIEEGKTVESEVSMRYYFTDVRNTVQTAAL